LQSTFDDQMDVRVLLQTTKDEQRAPRRIGDTCSNRSESNDASTMLQTANLERKAPRQTRAATTLSNRRGNDDNAGATSAPATSCLGEEIHQLLSPPKTYLVGCWGVCELEVEDYFGHVNTSFNISVPISGTTTHRLLDPRTRSLDVAVSGWNPLRQIHANSQEGSHPCMTCELVWQDGHGFVGHGTHGCPVGSVALHVPVCLELHVGKSAHTQVRHPNEVDGRGCLCSLYRMQGRTCRV